MRSRRSLVPLVLAMVMSAGCATKTIHVRVNLDASKNPVFDKDHHEMAFVKPGDRVAWICQCPPDTEFTVADLHFVADLHDVDEFVLRYAIGGPKELESEIQELESLQRKLSVAERPAESAEAMSKQTLQETVTLLKNLESAIFPEEQRNLFRGTSENRLDTEFVDGTERFRSPGRVAKGIGYGLWKFTWKVRRKGGPITDEWDPHIVGHEKPLGG